MKSNSITQEQKIKFQTAKLAFEKEIIPNVRLKKFSHFNSVTKKLDGLGIQGSMVCDHYYAFTQTQLQTYLRNEEKIIVSVSCIAKEFYSAKILSFNKKRGYFRMDSNTFNSWEEALEEGLQMTLKQLKSDHEK